MSQIEIGTLHIETRLNVASWPARLSFHRLVLGTVQIEIECLQIEIGFLQIETRLKVASWPARLSFYRLRLNVAQTGIRLTFYGL